MALTVFAEQMGFFHKGCAGTSVAPVDVCLTPPGVPVPYTNVLFAKDLIQGSKSVRIDGEPTFLEDYSQTSTSIGDEAGSLGSVVTGVHLGKGFFLVWSMTVQVEGLGVCRHGDLMGHNSASAPQTSNSGGASASAADVSAPEPTPVNSARAAEAEVLEATGPGDSTALVVVPCAMGKVEIECSHTGHGDDLRNFGPFEFTFNGNGIQTNDTSGDPDAIIGLIGGSTDDTADTVKITVSGGPGYTCDRSHPEILVVDVSDNSEVLKLNGATQAEFKAKTRVVELSVIDRLSPMAVLEYFWFPREAVRRYRVAVNSCGMLEDGTPDFGRLSRLVDVYPDDTYKLSLSIPEVFNREYNRPRGDDTDPETLRGLDGGLLDGSDWASEGGEYPIDLPAEEIAGSVTFSRNGETLTAASEKIEDIVKQIKAITDLVQGTFNYVEDLIPQLGWSFNIKLNVFCGDLSLEWGPKEANNFTVYNWWKFECNIILVSAEITVEFGFKGSAGGADLEAIGYFTVNGSLPMNIPAIEAKPDSIECEFEKFTIPLGFEGGVRVKVGWRWLSVSGQGSVSGGFPFEATPEIRQQRPGQSGGFVLNYAWRRDALKANVNVSALGGSISEEWTLIEGADAPFAQGTWFENPPPSQGVPSPAGPLTREQQRQQRRNNFHNNRHNRPAQSNGPVSSGGRNNPRGG